MPHACFMNGCRNRSNRGKSFFSIPAVIKHQGEKTFELSSKRRASWIAAINRKKDVTKYSKICSDHFITGKPAVLYDSTHPDWVPTLLLSEIERRSVEPELEDKSKNLLNRYQRSKRRHARKKENIENQFSLDTSAREHEKMESDEQHASYNCAFLKLGMCHSSQETVQRSYQDILAENESLSSENHKLKSENYELRKKLLTYKLSPEAFEEDEKKVSYMTGLSNFNNLMALSSLV